MIISNANSCENNITKNKENQQNLCYIYRHIRLDKNEVFYIGKGTNTTGNIDRTARKGELYECTACEVVIDADTNAAINILQRGTYSSSTAKQIACIS